MPKKRSIRVIFAVATVLFVVIIVPVTKRFILPQLQAHWLKNLASVGGAIVGIVVFLAALAELTGYSLKDLAHYLRMDKPLLTEKGDATGTHAEPPPVSPPSRADIRLTVVKQEFRTSIGLSLTACPKWLNQDTQHERGLDAAGMPDCASLWAKAEYVNVGPEDGILKWKPGQVELPELFDSARAEFYFDEPSLVRGRQLPRTADFRLLVPFTERDPEAFAQAVKALVHRKARYRIVMDYRTKSVDGESEPRQLAIEGDFSDFYERLVEDWQNYGPFPRLADLLRIEPEDQARAPERQELGKKKVARLKEILSAPGQQIELDDLVRQETTRVLELLSGNSFPMQAQPTTPENLASRLKQYESTTRTLQKIVALLARCATEECRPALESILAQVTDIHTPMTGQAFWLNLRRYPAIVLLYSAGISAVSANQYENLAAVLTQRVHYDLRNLGRQLNEHEIVLPIVEAIDILDRNPQKTFQQLPGYTGHLTPRSEYLFTMLRPTLDDLLPFGNDYEVAFDRFEMFLALVYADIYARETRDSSFPGPLGKFACKHIHSRSLGDPSIFDRLVQEAESQKDSWPPLRAGLFGGSYQRFQKVASGFAPLMNQLHRQ